MLPGKRHSFEDVLQILRRRVWFVLVPLTLVSVGTAVVASFLPDTYQSHTLLLVVPQRVPESYVRATVTSRIEDRLQSITQQILSRTRLERIIQDFNLYQAERQSQLMEDVVSGMRSDIGVDIVKGDAFRLSYISAEPRTAQKVAERLASLFIEENLRDREVLAEGTNQFLESQVEDARRRLTEHDRKLEEFRKKNAGELPSQLEANLQTLQSAQVQIQTLQDSINRDRDRRLVLDRLLADATAPDPAAPVASFLPGEDPTASGAPAAQQLEAAKAAVRGLELRLKPQHPDVARIKRLIRELEKKAEAEALERPLSASTGAAPNLSPAESAKQNKIKEMHGEVERIDREIGRKDDEVIRVRGVIAAYQQRVEAVPTRESELIGLTRDYDTLQQVYRTLLVKKEDSQASANLERRQIGEQFRILDPARLPEKPFSPNRPRICLFGALFGLAMGAGLAVLLEARDVTFKNEDDVNTALGLPVLALIPILLTVREQRRQLRRRVALSLAATGLVVVAATVAWKLTT